MKIQLAYVSVAILLLAAHASAKEEGKAAAKPEISSWLGRLVYDKCDSKIQPFTTNAVTEGTFKPEVLCEDVRKSVKATCIEYSNKYVCDKAEKDWLKAVCKEVLKWICK